MKKVFTGLILLILSSSIFAQVDKKGVQNSINKRAKEYENNPYEKEAARAEKNWKKYKGERQ